MTENEISYEVRGAIFEVYNSLGPGLLESVYQSALIYELESKGLNVKSELSLPLIYKGKPLGLNYRMDLLVEGKLVVEIKSVESLLNVHHKQLLTYLKLASLKLGILVNFNTESIKDNIFRKIN